MILPNFTRFYVKLRNIINGQFFSTWCYVCLIYRKVKDKIKGTVILKSNLYKGKYYTDVTLRDIEIVPDKPKEVSADGSEQISLSMEGHGDYIVDEETGEIIL